MHLVRNDLDSMTKTPLPSYSERRALLAEKTRQRVLDAVVETLGKGVTELSIPAVAKAAGVSVPTVTRHFKTKKGLMQAAAERLRNERGVGPTATTVEEFGEMVRREYKRAAELPDDVRAALQSELLRSHLRQAGAWKARRQAMDKFVRDAGTDLDGVELEHCVDVMTVIASSYFLRGTKSLLNHTSEQAAAAVTWAMKRLIGGRAVKPTKRKRGES